MSPTVKRRLFPLSGPRLQSRAFLPWHVVAEAVDAYHEAFFAAFTPPASPLREAGRPRTAPESSEE